MTSCARPTKRKRGYLNSTRPKKPLCSWSCARSKSVPSRWANGSEMATSKANVI